MLTQITVNINIFREHTPRQNTSTGSSLTSSHNYSPLSVSPHLSPKGPGYTPSGYSPAGSALTPVYSSPLTPLDSNYFETYDYEHRKNDDQENVHVTKQVSLFIDYLIQERFWDNMVIVKYLLKIK